jgi:hypothetical protein
MDKVEFLQIWLILCVFWTMWDGVEWEWIVSILPATSRELGTEQVAERVAVSQERTMHRKNRQTLLLAHKPHNIGILICFKFCLIFYSSKILIVQYLQT